MASGFDSHCTMFSADSALAVLCTCDDKEIENALRQGPEAITKLRTALDSLPSLHSTARAQAPPLQGRLHSPACLSLL